MFASVAIQEAGYAMDKLYAYAIPSRLEGEAAGAEALFPRGLSWGPWGRAQEGGSWSSAHFVSFHSVVITVVIRPSKRLFKSSPDVLQERGSEQSSPPLKVAQRQCRESPAHGSGLRSSVFSE